MCGDDHMVVKINDGRGGFIFEHRGFAELERVDRRKRIPPGTGEYGDFELLYSDGAGCSGWVWIGARVHTCVIGVSNTAGRSWTACRSS